LGVGGGGNHEERYHDRERFQMSEHVDLRTLTTAHDRSAGTAHVLITAILLSHSRLCNVFELAADGAHLHDSPLRRSCMHMAECAGRVEGARTGTPAHVSATAAGTFVVAQIHITQRPHRALR